MIRVEPSPPANGLSHPHLPQGRDAPTPQHLQDSYFVPPTPGPRYGGNGGVAWTPFAPADGSSHRSGFGETGGGDGGFFGHGAAAGDSGASDAPDRSRPGHGASAIATDGDRPREWANARTPSFALSPSSNAFSASFNRLGGFSGAHDIPPTPLHPPASSPFIPTGAEAQPNPFDSAVVPQTPGAGSSPAPQAGPGVAPKLNFPISLPFVPGRKVAPRPSARPSPAASSNGSSTSTSRYTPIVPTALFSLVRASLTSSASSPPLLVLDIRTHTSYLSERLVNSINVCVPSTLLRRPGFGVDRVQEGLPEAEQDVFAAWNACETIVAIDTESTSLAEGSSGVASLLGKFDRAGFQGKLGWVKGGWYAVKTQARGLSRPETSTLFQSGSGSPTSSASSTPNLATDSAARSDQAFSLNQPPAPGSKKHGRPVLQVRDLPMAAFQVASTSAFVHSGGPSNSSSSVGVTSPSSDGSASSRRPNLGKRRKSSNDPTASDPSFTLGGRGGVDAMPTPIGESPPTPRGGADQAQRNVQGAVKMSTNPFFDNIRQNSEALSLDRSLANLNPVELPSVPAALLPTLPPFLRDLLDMSPMQRADKLARQFYELEVAERERLEGTFRWHARHTTLQAAPFGQGGKKGQELDDGEESPETKQWKRFGISAGVELGSLNRFKNIFPYEHRRVKLTDHSPSATDYINASHLRLPPSAKRFVASQGPLPTTYSDFWQMCEQEHVGVIIMLTNLNEGGREKCGRYWITPEDGQKDWEVTVEGDQAHEEEAREWQRERKNSGGLFGGGASTGGFFAPADAQVASRDEQKPTTRSDCTVRRTLTVKRLGGRGFDPSATNTRPRKIRHIQYRAWPDFDIPADPADVVSLVDEVDAAQASYMQEIGWRLEDHDGMEPPILAHCSAGVGRTGVYIMVSSLLDQMRRSRRSDEEKKRDGVVSMDVDSNSPPSSGAATPSRPDLVSRSSDPETSSLSAHLSLSTLDSSSAQASPSGTRASTVEPSTATTSLSSDPSASPLRRPEPGSISGPHPVLPDADGPTPALLQDDPIFAGVNALREQRMSMVANYRQYVCVVECLLEGFLREAQQDQKQDGK
ncbi:hypothetical protein JCM10212_005249 [Sporobolomyces blumeae]